MLLLHYCSVDDESSLFSVRIAPDHLIAFFVDLVFLFISTLHCSKDIKVVSKGTLYIAVRFMHSMIILN